MYTSGRLKITKIPVQGVVLPLRTILIASASNVRYSSNPFSFLFSDTQKGSSVALEHQIYAYIKQLDQTANIGTTY